MSTRLMAILGALVVAAGIAMVFVPAGVIAAGIELIAGAYLRAYLEARR